jgi:hypothetical protein
LKDIDGEGTVEEVYNDIKKDVKGIVNTKK